LKSQWKKSYWFFGGNSHLPDKALKFLSSEDAINDVFIDLAVHPDNWYVLALFAKVYGFLT
jgi:hypothetical protein